MKKIYIETSIPSFYYEIRQEPDMIARKDWTRFWWDNERKNYDLFTSVAVLFELENGDYPTKDQCLKFIENIPVLEVNQEINEIVDTYISRSVMPNDPLGDPLHLAIASYYKCDFLLTWNCIHLANANKFRHIQVVNTMMGLFIPSLITPLQLMEGD